MDHPEPITVKHEVSIPQSRKNMTLEEVKQFADQIMETFRSLEGMLDLRSMYETGKQLSRVFFDCHQHRAELAQYLNMLDYPAFASKMMKKLNNMGVFKNDDIWFSSFYFYNTTWNFSEIWPDFATALGTAGLPNLLNLNIGHQPYLENLASKNVYYLIKASLSIIHNIARVPSNVHYFNSEAVRQALIHLSLREEEFLRCVSTLCLAYILTDSETDFLTTNQQGGTNSLLSLLGYVSIARNSEKHRCHGLQAAELLSALTALSANDSVKSNLLTISMPGDQSFVTMLKEVIEVTLKSDPIPTPAFIRDAEEAIKIMLNLAIGPQSSCAQLASQLGTWHTDLLNDSSKFNLLPKSVARCLEMLVWRLTTGGAPRNNPMKDHIYQNPGLILFSYSSASKMVVDKITDRIKSSGLKIIPTNINFSDALSLADACSVRLSGLQASSSSQLAWLDQMDAAEIIVVCINDIYRQSAACRFEAEYLQEHVNLLKKSVVFVNLQPKYKPSGWLHNLLYSSTNANKAVIDFSGKRDTEISYENLLAQLVDLHEGCKNRAQSKILQAKQEEVIHNNPAQTFLPKQNIGDQIGAHTVSPPPVSYPSTNHIDTRDGSIPPQPTQAATLVGDYKRYTMPSNSLLAFQMPVSQSSQPNVRGWKYVVRPDIRNWTAAKVAQWFKFRGLQAITANLAGGLDGVMLSQLAAMRCMAPEAFHRSLREDLSLTLVDCLKLLEALDDLAPEDQDCEQKNHNGAAASESCKVDDGDDLYEKFSNLSGPDSQHRLMAHNYNVSRTDNYH